MVHNPSSSTPTTTDERPSSTSDFPTHTSSNGPASKQTHEVACTCSTLTSQAAATSTLSSSRVSGLFLLRRSVFKSVLMILVIAVISQLLVISGDVETNPGPRADAKPCLSELQKMTYNDEAGKSAHIRLMERIRPHFKQVAIALKFCHHDIDTIEKKDDPVYDLLSKWLEGANQEEDPRPLTWETLITAIRDAGVHEVANILTKYLVQPVVHNDDTCLKASDPILSFASKSASPVHGYIDYLKTYYSSKRFPGFSKEALRVRPEGFIHLNLVTIEKIDMEDCATSLQTLHTYGNIKRMKEMRKAIEMADVCKNEGGSVPLSILVEGAPGIGKSTFSWELCRQWKQGEMLKNWTVVILLQLRNKQVREAKTLSDLLYNPDQHANELVIEYIKSIHGKGVMIIFDGYDELPEEYMTENSIFHRLLFKELLSRCTVMVTSRPIANSRLYTEFKNTVDQHIEIIGFAEEDIDSYIESTCQRKSDVLFDDLKLYLSSNPFVYSAAYLPFQCAVVTALYIENWKKEGKIFAPSTLTGLYTNLVEVLLQRHADDNHPKYKKTELTITKLLELQLSAHPFWKLAKLAAEGLEKQQYVFENVECDTMGMMQNADDTLVNRQGTAVHYCFLHHTLQEYLAALHWFRLGSDETVRLVKEYLAALHWFRQGPNQTVPVETMLSPEPEKKATEGPLALFFLSGLSELKSVPIEYLQVAFQSHRVYVSDASYAIHLLGSAFCKSRICRPPFLTTLFETQSSQLTASVFADKVVNVLINSQLDAFVAAWCLSHSDPTSSWYINMKVYLAGDFLEKKSIEYFEKQLNSLDCHANHGKIAGIAVKDKGSLSSLLSLDPHTQDLELLWLYGSDRLQSDNEAEMFATRLNEVYPNLKYLVIIEPEWTVPILSRLQELRSLKAISFTGGSVNFSLPLQNCKSLETMWLQFSTTCAPFLESLVVPNVNTIVNLFLLFPLTDDNIEVLCACLCQATRHRMTLSYNSALSGAKALSDAIKQKKSLEWVNLQDVKGQKSLEYFTIVAKLFKMSQ